KLNYRFDFRQGPCFWAVSENRGRESMNIFAKLTGAFAVVALICAMVGTVGWYGIDRTEESLATVSDVKLPGIQGLGLIMESMNGIKSAERTLLISGLTLKDRRHERDNLTT